MLLSCLLHGLDMQNQKCNCCLNPTYFTEVGTRDTHWPCLRPRRKQKAETRVTSLWRWQPLHKRAQAAEICKRSCVKFPMSLHSGPWHRIMLAAPCCTASNLVAVLCSKSCTHRQYSGREVSFVPTPGLGAQEVTTAMHARLACQARDYHYNIQLGHLKNLRWTKRELCQEEKPRSFHFSV